MQQLAHGVAEGDGLVTGVLGDDAAVQGAHRRVAAHRRQGGHPQVAAHQIVAAPAHDVATRPPRLAVASNAAGHLEGQHAEGGDEFVGTVEAVDVEEEGREHGGGDGADARDGVEVVGLGQRPIGLESAGFPGVFDGPGYRGVGGPDRAPIRQQPGRPTSRWRSGRVEQRATC